MYMFTLRLRPAISGLIVLIESDRRQNTCIYRYRNSLELHDDPGKLGVTVYFAEKYEVFGHLGIEERASRLGHMQSPTSLYAGHSISGVAQSHFLGEILLWL